MDYDDRSTPNTDHILKTVMECLERDLQHRVEPGDVMRIQRSWRQQLGVASSELRRMVYKQNLWLTSLLNVGQPRDISPEDFRFVPKIPSIQSYLPVAHDVHISSPADIFIAISVLGC
jgi:hypothetical protein